jgi:hypothetical protein
MTRVGASGGLRAPFMVRDPHHERWWRRHAFPLILRFSKDERSTNVAIRTKESFE